MGFNPRARVGRDASARPARRGRGRFNPRARVGRDKTPRLLACWTSCFNPRARVGRDALLSDLDLADHTVSIHAPAWGATRSPPISSWRSSRFQSTRPRGARQPHHNSLRDKDFFRVTREPMLSLDPKGTGQVAATQKPMKSISC